MLPDGIVCGERMEHLLAIGACCGTSFLVLNAVLGKKAKQMGGRPAKVFVELQRKSFHILGGCMLSGSYHWGLKRGLLASAFHGTPTDKTRLDAGSVFLAITFVCWLIEFSRLQIPAVQKWYLRNFRGLVRQKEHQKAAGNAYFLPGILAAMLAAPPNVANLAIMMLSLGDAGASLGTAAGSIPVGSSPRKVEGSILCFSICTAMSLFVRVPLVPSLVSSAVVTFGEVLAEVIGLDDNLVLPMLGVLGLRLAYASPETIKQMGFYVGGGLVLGIALGTVVSLTTPKEETSEDSKKSPAN